MNTNTQLNRQCRGGGREGRPPSDFRAGIPKSALDVVTSPRIRYKQNKLKRRGHYREEAEELRSGPKTTSVPVAPTVKWFPSVVQSQR